MNQGNLLNLDAPPGLGVLQATKQLCGSDLKDASSSAFLLTLILTEHVANALVLSLPVFLCELAAFVDRNCNASFFSDRRSEASQKC